MYCFNPNVTVYACDDDNDVIVDDHYHNDDDDEGNVGDYKTYWRVEI